MRCFSFAVAHVLSESCNCAGIFDWEPVSLKDPLYQQVPPTLLTDGSVRAFAFNDQSTVLLPLSFQGQQAIRALTVGVWLRTSSYSTTEPSTANQALLDFDESEYFSLRVTPAGMLSFGSSHNGLQASLTERAGKPLADGEWHYAAFTFRCLGCVDGVADGMKRIFRDGVLTANSTSLEAIGSSAALKRYGVIGDGSEISSIDPAAAAAPDERRISGDFFDGDIALVHMHPVVLSAVQVSITPVWRICGA